MISSIRTAAACVLLTGLASSQAAEMALSRGGKALATIVVAPDATVVEKHAAAELASFLKQVTGAEFAIQEVATIPADRCWSSGRGRCSARWLPICSPMA